MSQTVLSHLIYYIVASVKHLVRELLALSDPYCLSTCLCVGLSVCLSAVFYKLLLRQFLSD